MQMQRADSAMDLAGAALPGAARRRRERTAVVLWTAIGCLFLLTYSWTLRDLVRGWLERDRLVLGLVVLAGAVYLAWDRRGVVLRARSRPSRWGFAFLAASALLLFVGTRASLVFLSGMTGVFLRGASAVAFLCGLGLLAFGAEGMKPLWLPALLLLFIYPENSLTSYWVPLRLQTLATVMCERIVSLLGIAVVREGHVLETATFSANVEEACSGIRSLMTVVPTAMFISAYGLRRLGPKVALVLLAVPMTIFANVVRVTVTVILGIYAGSAAAEGFFHYFAGIGIFLLSLAGLLALVELLKLVERGSDDPTTTEALPAPSAPAARSRSAAAPHRTRLAALAAGAVLAAGLFYQGLELRWAQLNAERYATTPLASVPLRLGRWTGRDLPELKALETQRQVSDALFREYRCPGRPLVQVLVLYWRRGAGTLLGRRAHRPEGCYPYHGMEELWSRPIQVATARGSVSAFTGPAGDLLVTSWQQSGPGPEAQSRLPGNRFALYADGLREILRLNAGYPPEIAVQLITPSGALPDRAEAAQRELASLLFPVLTETCLLPAEGETVGRSRAERRDPTASEG